MMLTIRPFAEKDYEATTAVWNAAWSDYKKRYWSSNPAMNAAIPNIFGSVWW
ncbi:MAG: hypothetical protein H6658_04265 [Ardenticatenaceae bacterium]|nr:hypothetical protein [Ardenticatenaceae bacterium]